MSGYAKYVRKHEKLILDALSYIWSNAETGYREWKTHAYMEEAFAKLDYELTLAGDIPGFTAEFDTGKEGPTIAVFAEMDSLICASHPDANKETGAVHACGHCAQAAALIGLAAALKEKGAADEMCGKIRLVAVPAEELIEVEYREELRKKGIIRYFGGKPEFLHRGLLDGVDMCLMVHTGGGAPNSAGMNSGSNGCIVKKITFHGVAAHAGGAPHMGVNALYAANLALNAANALRETFKDNSHIRFHPIITHGGDAVNAIPERVEMESYVRGANMDEIVSANRKLNRAIAASAAAMGAKVHLQDSSGYWPRRYPAESFDIVKAAMEQVVDTVSVDPSGFGTASSDLGDMCAVMPALHPNISGASGTFHGKDFKITDSDTACVKSAELQLVLLVELLKEGGKKAKELIKSYQPEFASKEEYFDFVDSLKLDTDAVSYEGDNKVILNF